MLYTFNLYYTRMHVAVYRPPVYILYIDNCFMRRYRYGIHCNVLAYNKLSDQLSKRNFDSSSHNKTFKNHILIADNCVIYISDYIHRVIIEILRR